MDRLGIQGRRHPMVGAPPRPATRARTRTGKRRWTADWSEGGWATSCDEMTCRHGKLDAPGKRRRSGATRHWLQQAQVAERLDTQPRESQHPQPDQKQHADPTAQMPQNPPSPARLIDQNARRKIAHAHITPPQSIRLAMRKGEVSHVWQTSRSWSINANFAATLGYCLPGRKEGPPFRRRTTGKNMLISTDYLVVGAGASGLAFADALQSSDISHTSARQSSG